MSSTAMVILNFFQDDRNNNEIRMITKNLCIGGWLQHLEC
jgi:hypothetical protein